MKLPSDHIYAILIAFLASLGSYTTLLLIGSDATPSSKIGDVVLALAGVIGGYAFRPTDSKKPPE